MIGTEVRNILLYKLAGSYYLDPNGMDYHSLLLGTQTDIGLTGVGESGSVVGTSFATFYGTFLTAGTYLSMVSYINTVLSETLQGAYSTTVSANLLSGATLECGVIYSFGSSQIDYPQFGRYWVSEIAYEPSVRSLDGTFAGFKKARLYDTYDSGAYIDGSIVYQAVAGTCATIVAEGENQSSLPVNPGISVLYATISGIDNVPLCPFATMQKYIYDPQPTDPDAPNPGEGWKTIEVGDYWSGTFIFLV